MIKNLSKKTIIEIIVAIVVVGAIIFAMVPKGIHATYQNSDSLFGSTETDTMVLSGKTYNETVVTKQKDLTGKTKTSTEKYSGTFSVSGDKVTFDDDTANGHTATLSSDKKVLSIQNGQDLTQK